MDDYKSKMQDTVLLLASVNGDKVSLVSSVPKDLTDKVKAGDIIREAAQITNGKVAVALIWLKAAEQIHLK